MRLRDITTYVSFTYIFYLARTRMVKLSLAFILSRLCWNALELEVALVGEDAGWHSGTWQTLVLSLERENSSLAHTHCLAHRLSSLSFHSSKPPVCQWQGPPPPTILTLARSTGRAKSLKLGCLSLLWWIINKQINLYQRLVGKKASRSWQES